MPAGEIAEGLRLPPLHAQEIGGARHVDIEEGAAHQEVGRLGGDVLGELGEALGRNYAGEAPLATPAHEVGHGAERELPRLVRNLARHGGGEKLRLIDDDEHRIPVVAPGLEQPAQEGGGTAHLPLGVEPLQVEHGRDAVDAGALPRQLQRLLGLRLGVDHEVAEALAERHEIALRVDHALLHPGRALLQQAAQQMGFAGPGIALDEEARRQQFLEVEGGRRAASIQAGRRVAQLDCNGHADSKSPIRVGLINPSSASRACHVRQRRPWRATPAAGSRRSARPSPASRPRRRRRVAAAA